MTAVSTHVLDAVRGKPAAGVAIQLAALKGDEWVTLAKASTDDDGRCRDLASEIPEGTYRITFFSREYLERLGRTSIYPEIVVVFACRGESHLHLPLLLSDNSYTTYRGS